MIIALTLHKLFSLSLFVFPLLPYLHTFMSHVCVWKNKKFVAEGSARNFRRTNTEETTTTTTTTERATSTSSSAFQGARKNSRPFDNSLRKNISGSRSVGSEENSRDGDGGGGEKLKEQHRQKTKLCAGNFSRNL